MDLYSPESFILKTLQWEIPEEDKIYQDFEPDFNYKLLDTATFLIPCIFNLRINLLEHVRFMITNSKEAVRFDLKNNTLWLLKEQLYKLKLDGKLKIQGNILTKNNYIPSFIEVNKAYFNFQLPYIRGGEGRYSMVKKIIYSRFIYNDIFYNVLLTNLPYSYYKEAIPSKSCYLIYDFRSMRYTMGVNDEESSSFLFDNFNSILKDGIKFPVISFLLDKGNIFHLDSQKRSTLANYMRIPYIPSFVIQTNFPDPEFIVDSNCKDLSNIANSLFAPYFIL